MESNEKVLTEAEHCAIIIKSVASALGLKLNQFAELVGVNKQQLYAYTNGDRVPAWGFWKKVKTTFPHVSGDFLLTGRGAVLLNQANSLSDRA